MTRGLGAANCEDQATVWRLLSARLLTMRGVFALPNNAEQARETSGRPEKAPARLTADRRASTNPICSEELGEFVTTETAARSCGPTMGFVRRNRAPSVRQKSTVCASSQPVKRMQGISIPCALIRRESSIPFTPDIPISEIKHRVVLMSGLARNSSPEENSRASYPAEWRRSPSVFRSNLGKFRGTSSTTF
jgi:hypothetical protein